MHSLKDVVFNKSGRLGKIVGSTQQEGEETSYRVLWYDNDKIGDALDSEIENYYPIFRAVEE